VAIGVHSRFADNALNACLAVIRFKQLRGFYFEESPYYHLLQEIGDLKVVGELEV